MTGKILICYGSRYGSTTEVVHEMAKTATEIGFDVETVNLKHDKPSKTIPDYDLVLIGSGIQAGRWTKEPLEFIKNNLDVLSKSKVAIFVVCGYAASPDKCETAQIEYLDNIAAEYSDLTPVSTGLFGGVFDFKKYSFPVRALVKRLVKSELPPGEEVPDKIDHRNWDKIRAWITELVSS